MKTHVTFEDFAELFKRYDRVENFGLDGLKALFNYVEELEADTGHECELDIIALCCDFTRYDSVEQYNRYHNDTADDAYDIESLACVIEGTDAFICYVE
jgi:hypothetical protein